MLVSVISPDLSHNCLGRAYVLAQLIERNHDVEIVGPQLGDGIWEPIKEEYNYRGIKTGSLIHQFPFAISDLLDQISGDIVYVSKPRTTSYGLGLLATLGRDRPLILDIDDWESGFRYKNGKFRAYIGGIPRLVGLNTHYYTRGWELLSGLADAITVSNSFLQNQFGGEIIPHAKDTDKLDPSKYDKTSVRNELNLPLDDFIVMFSGTPRPHKGVDILAQAVSNIDQQDITAVVVGAHKSEYVDKIRQIGRDSMTIKGMQPFENIPKWLAAADVIAIPQKDNPATKGQLPSKVFDAMSMAKPIIATDVNDLSTILDGCGRIVEPGNVSQLQNTIIELYNNPKVQTRMGEEARKKCIKFYSYNAMAPKINHTLSKVITNNE